MKTAYKKQNFVEELRPFENKWVALVNEKVIASGKNPREVREKAEQAGHEHFAFYLVPSFSVSFAPYVWV